MKCVIDVLHFSAIEPTLYFIYLAITLQKCHEVGCHAAGCECQWISNKYQSYRLISQKSTSGDSEIDFFALSNCF